MRRSFSALIGGLAFLLLWASPAFAAGGDIVFTHNNLVEVTNSNSAQPAVGTGVALAYDGPGAAVTDENLAYAQSSDCTGCRTVAVAVQVIVVAGSPSNFQPQNAAVAVNSSCNSCQTFAYAHQYVVQMTHPFVYSSAYQAAAAQVERISWQIYSVAHSGEDFATMSSQLDQLSLQYFTTVDRALQSQTNGDSGHESEYRQVNRD